jgi:hypothetical protein
LGRDEQIDTVALGWTGRDVYVRVPDRRYWLTSVWLNAADVTRRQRVDFEGSGVINHHRQHGRRRDPDRPHLAQ